MRKSFCRVKPGKLMQRHFWYDSDHSSHSAASFSTVSSRSTVSLRTVVLAFVVSLTLVIALVCANSSLALADTLTSHSLAAATAGSHSLAAAAAGSRTPFASAATRLPRPHQQAYAALAKGQNPAIITLLGSPEESHFSALSLSDEQLCVNLVSASEGKPNQIVSATSSATLQTGASAVDRFSQAQVEATAQAGPLLPELFASRLQKCTLPGQYAPLSSQEREKIISQASATADEAVQESQGTSHPLTRHELHYCVATRGSVSESLEQFENKIFRTLNSPEGWPRAGVTFRFAHAASGSGSDGVSGADTNTSSGASTSSASNAVDCDFTLWLSEASQVPSFSSYCSVEYSCRVGNAVIINQSRWNEPTSSWLNGGGNLENYRTMVLNHEVGHRLGHMDNENVCASPNGPAPLMQEQSISLRGCSIRWWPQSLELWTAGL